MSNKKKEMESVRELALKHVKESAVTSSSKLDRKLVFHELLLNKEMKREDVEFEVAWQVYKHEFGEDAELNKKELDSKVKSVRKSIANFCSKSHRESTAKATYNYDPAFAEFELIVDKAKRTLKIVQREE